MRLLLCTSLGLAVSSFAQAQSDQVASPHGEFHAKSSYAEWKRSQEGPWVVEWNAATLTPRAIFGNGLPIANWTTNTLQAARMHANEVLATHRDMLGLGTSEFRESIGAQMGRTWSFKFDQFFKGLPVVGGRADVRINMRGVVAMMGSTAFPIPANFDITPAIGEELATGIAWRTLEQDPTGVPQPGQVRNPQLVIWGDANATDLAAFALAWEVPISNVDRNGAGPIGRYYVDAKTGAVLHYRTDKHECGGLACASSHPGSNVGTWPLAAPVVTTVTVMGWTRTGNDALSPLVNTPLANLVVNVTGLGTRTTDQNGEFTVDIAAPVTASVGALDGTHHNAIAGANPTAANVVVNPGVNATLQILTAAATTNEAAHTTSTYWVNRTHEWCAGILSTQTGLNLMNTIGVNVNVAGTCNAFYNGSSINFYPAGGGCSNTAFSTVISHEWGHGLDDKYGGISNASGDGLSEGWGDIIGMYLVDSPILGSGFQTAGTGIRNGMNTKMYGSQTEVHAAGEIWMGFAWRYRENLRAAFGSQLALQISEDTVIESIVADAANQADAVRQVFIADDDDGNLNNGTPHYAQLSAAAIAKGIPYPQIQVASVSTVALGNTAVRLTPRLVNATASAVSSGTINQVRLVYNAGAGSVTRVMIPNGFVNGYRGMLPGIVSGSVNYHVEATHSSGTVVRTPATGEYTYIVSVPPTGAFTNFYTETFDTGAAGWTSGVTTGTGNDWQLGAPNGKTSTVSGVLWSDPTAAASTGSVYGTDLGAGTSNGRYPNNINYYLRSPIINCSGRTGVTLRFKRWLTVEEGIYDVASVSVNGVQVWANPLNGNLVDTAWSTVEYAIPAADNNASVQVEFRLLADAGLNLGGWNIDQFELGTRFTPPLAAELRMTPEQAAGGTPISINVTTQGGPKLFYLVIGDTAGPTIFAGVPPILVGGSFFLALPDVTNAAGTYTNSFGAPTAPSTTGMLWYSQVVTLDVTNTTIVTSNQWLNLFTL